MRWLWGIRLVRCVLPRASFDRSSATKIFKRGLDAYNHPDFYRQLGQPDEITAVAVTALVEQFGPPAG
jgi:hypothetical protein